MAQARRGGLITDAETATSSPATLAAATRAGACAGWQWQRRARLSEEINFLAKSLGLSHAYLPGSAAASPEVSHGAWQLLLPWEGGSRRIPALGARRLLAGSLAPAGQHTDSSMPNPTSTRRFGQPEGPGRRRWGRPCAHTRRHAHGGGQVPGVPTARQPQPLSPHAAPRRGGAAAVDHSPIPGSMPRGAADTGAHASDRNARQHRGCRWKPGAGGGAGGPAAPSPHTARPHSPRARSRGYLARSACVSSQRGAAQPAPLLSSAWHTSLPGLKITPISSASCSPSPAGLCPAPPAPAQPWQGHSRGCEGFAGREPDQGKHGRGWHLAPLQHSSPCSPQKGQGHRAGPATSCPGAQLPFGLAASPGSGLGSAFFGAVLSHRPTSDTPRLPSGLAAARGRRASRLPRTLPTPGLCQLHGFCPCPRPRVHPEGERAWVCAGARVPALSACTGAARCIPAQAAVCTPPWPRRCPGCRGVTEPPAEQPRGLSEERDLGGVARGTRIVCWGRAVVPEPLPAPLPAQQQRALSHPLPVPK